MPDRTSTRSPSLGAWRLRTALALALACGCASRDERPVIESTEAFGNDHGTLVSVADVREVSAAMVASLDASGRVRALRSEGPLTIRIDRLVHLTTITNFDKELFVNHLVGELMRAGGGRYRFFDRQSVARERELQASGDVTGGDPTALAGADWVLAGDIREILHRERVDAGEVEKRTVHYALRLVSVRDGEIAWSHAVPIVKQQVIGVAYR